MSNVWWDQNVQIENSGCWIIRNKLQPKGHKLVGRSSFKFANLLSMHFSGIGGEYPRGALDVAKEWIEHNQKIFGREDVVLRVFGETKDWGNVPAGEGMFGSPARDQGIWNVKDLTERCESRRRLKGITSLHQNVLAKAFQLSHETGCIFEWTIDATLKHTDGMCTDVLDDVMRQTGLAMRALFEQWPNAAFIVNARNEWNAHNETNTTRQQVNLWAQRWYRWKLPRPGHPDGADTKLSFTSPGDGWQAEQWPEALFIVDGGGKDRFTYKVGPEPGLYKVGMIHPERGPDDRQWFETPLTIADLRRDARGQPIGANELMYFLSRGDTFQWYRHRASLTEDVDLYRAMLGNFLPAFDYLIVHDDIGAQTDADFNRGSRYESMLAKFFEGNVGDPPPTCPDGQMWDGEKCVPIPSPPPKETTFEVIIKQAYIEIFGRLPDPAGLAHYDRQMREGRTEAGVRESLIRSQEFADKNPRGD